MSTPDASARPGQLPLFGGDGDAVSPGSASPAPAGDPPDAGDRAAAVDPRHHVVLEASAGTGKTSVLVRRYLNLLAAGVDPANVLAITFTRKAAAEMRERIVRELRREAALSEHGRRLWLRLRDRVGDIAISTIDAFCLSLLREFPLEADLDPAFRIADDTEVARLLERSLDAALRVGRSLAREHDDLAVVLVELTTRQLRAGLRTLLDRRCVAMPALAGYLARADAPASAAAAVARAAAAALDVLAATPGGLAGFLESGPVRARRFDQLARDLTALAGGRITEAGDQRRVLEQLADYVFTHKGKPRAKVPYAARDFSDAASVRRHRVTFTRASADLAAVFDRLERDVNAVLARGVQRLAVIAERAYLRALDEEDLVDFTEALARSVALLEQMDEFSRSRFRLESRYHHVLVDEFQDTSRLQWRLVSLLVEAWRAGEGVAAPLAPSIFVVGDRKQSIYRFRDAEVAILDEAGRYIAALNPRTRPARAITTSFRSVPALLAFVNDLFDEVAKEPSRSDAFRYGDSDRFPLLPDSSSLLAGDPVLGLAAASSPADAAGAVADEVVRILSGGVTVRDRETGVARAAQPGDIAILFRSRDSHREFEAALEARNVPTYVYRGLGFFGSDEIQDLSALIRYLARPDSAVREAALLRSRIVRLSDGAVAALAPHLGDVLRSAVRPAAFGQLAPDDQEVLTRSREAVASWLALADRVPPADLLDQALRDTAYVFEMRGPRYAQARENVKKFRGLLRRIQNRGYATLARIADHLDRLSAGDESNASLDAVNAVNLMTVHASKGLEFPVVFVVGLARGTGSTGQPVRVVSDDGGGSPAASVGTLRFEADEEEKRRDREETKRLLYVALTRARDRLYLSGVLGADGRFAPRPGSLGEALPRSFGEAIEAAGTRSGPRVTWAGRGRTHSFLVARPADGGVLMPGSAAEAAADSREDLLQPLPAAPCVPVTTVRALVQPDGTSLARRWNPEGAGDALAGRLVHRLFQSMGPGIAGAGTMDCDAALHARARALVLADERDLVAEPDEAVHAACALWRDMKDRPDVAELFAGAEVLYEVPFSMRGQSDPAGTVVRGVIDCLVRRPNGEIVVVEIKTGRAADWHEAQLAMYVEAARGLFPASRVRGVLLTAETGSGRISGARS
jgi:ATP-dependent helicase/nuclease subunit A